MSLASPSTTVSPSLSYDGTQVNYAQVVSGSTPLGQVRRGLHYQQNPLNSSCVNDLALWSQNQRPENLLTLSHSIRRFNYRACDVKRKIFPVRVLSYFHNMVPYSIDLCGDDIAHAFVGIPLSTFRVVTQAHAPIANLSYLLRSNPKFFLKPCSFNNRRHTGGPHVHTLTDYAQALGEELEHAQQRGYSNLAGLFVLPIIDDTVAAKFFRGVEIRAAYSFLRPFLTGIVVIQGAVKKHVVQTTSDELVLEDAPTSK